MMGAILCPAVGSFPVVKRPRGGVSLENSPAPRLPSPFHSEGKYVLLYPVCPGGVNLAGSSPPGFSSPPARPRRRSADPGPAAPGVLCPLCQTEPPSLFPDSILTAPADPEPPRLYGKLV